eukprot:CAMPEP_0198592480 /NCGR_PEP_ID=MMETSP1462-20131121/138188_1 /TAXON_ID=1333877 /ORGANISM="Brandtodinium nutriculum, Strain RCC3387" /LENGTH=105 /DNA_ID=CAMNT_0044324061 /DNA_START=19 /DNA_END=333 /DNA_ORIENTATION=-
MGLELDIDWDGFHWLNVAFLLVYTFEVMAKMKRQGCGFFTGASAGWNIVDLLISLGGLVGLLAIPVYEAVIYAGFGQASQYASFVSGFLSMLPIFRLFRVLRLYK